MMEKKFGCLDCNETGIIEAWTGDGETHTWTCQECDGTGFLNQKEFKEQSDCFEAFRNVMAQENL